MPTEFFCRAAAVLSKYAFRQRFFCARESRVCFFSYGCWVDRCVSFLIHNLAAENNNHSSLNKSIIKQ